MLDAVKNFVIVEVSGGYDAVATSIVLTAGAGAKLPDPAADGEFNLIWWNSTDYPNPADDPSVEIVRLTAKTTDTLTVSRAQESTDASVKNETSKTYKMMLALTAKTITDIETQKLSAGGDAHSAAVVFGSVDAEEAQVYTNGSARVRVSATGEVAISVGGVAPVSSVPLRVVDQLRPATPFSDAIAQFAGAEGAFSFILLDASNHIPAYVTRHSTGTQESPGATTSGAFMGGLVAYGHDGDSFEVGGRLLFNSAETWSGTALGTNLYLQMVGAGGTSLTTKAVFWSNGRMSIGGGGAHTANDVIHINDGALEITSASSQFIKLYTGSGTQAGIKMTERETGEYGMAMYHDGGANRLEITEITGSATLGSIRFSLTRSGLAAFHTGGLYVGGSSSWNSTFTVLGDSVSNGFAFGVLTTDVTVDVGANYGSIMAQPKTISGAATGTHTILANGFFATPNVVNNGGTIANAATLFVEGAPSNGANNYSLFVGGGLTRVGGDFELPSPTVPVSAGAAGRVGQLSWDSSYLYICVAANTWKRTSLSSW